MELSECYKEHYFYELSMVDRLTRNAALSFGFLLFLGGVAMTMLNSPSHLFHLSFAFFMTFAFICILVSGGFLAMSYLAHEYAVVPTPFEMNEFCNDLNRCHQQIGNNAEDAAAAAVRDTEGRLQLEYCNRATQNRQSNERRMKLLYYGNCGLVASSFFLIWAEIPHIVRSLLG